MSDASSTTNQNRYYTLWAVVTVVISFIICFVNTKLPGHPGFFLKFFGSLICVIPGFIGFLVGDYIRKFTIPDMIITNGGMSSIAKQKLFWLFGPQIIGIVIGIAFGASQFFKLFA